MESSTQESPFTAEQEKELEVLNEEAFLAKLAAEVQADKLADAQMEGQAAEIVRTMKATQDEAHRIENDKKYSAEYKADQLRQNKEEGEAKTLKAVEALEKIYVDKRAPLEKAMRGEDTLKDNPYLDDGGRTRNAMLRVERATNINTAVLTANALATLGNERDLLAFYQGTPEEIKDSVRTIVAKAIRAKGKVETMQEFNRYEGERLERKLGPTARKIAGLQQQMVKLFKSLPNPLKKSAEAQMQATHGNETSQRIYSEIMAHGLWSTRPLPSGLTDAKARHQRLGLL